MTSPEFPCTADTLRLAGPVGALEAIATCPTPDKSVRASAVICHPLPTHGGTMRNKVVHTLARGFSELGLRTVRFNFRGVGASAGRFDRGVGETEDLIAVLEWLRARRPDDEIWLAGFSFGAYVCARAVDRFPVARLITVAPPVNLYDFSALTPIHMPWLVIHGDEDEIVPATEVATWVQTHNPSPELVMLRGVNHFFHQRLNDLRATLVESLTPHLPASDTSG